MADMVNVGCKMPNGMILEVDGKKAVLEGAGNAGGHSITAVDAQFWEEWAKRNASLTVLTRGFVFAEKKMDSAKARAEEMKNEKTGLEQLDPDSPMPGDDLKKFNPKE